MNPPERVRPRPCEPASPSENVAFSGQRADRSRGGHRDRAASGAILRAVSLVAVVSP